jgi:hypothetical protein
MTIAWRMRVLSYVHRLSEEHERRLLFERYGLPTSRDALRHLLLKK